MLTGERPGLHSSFIAALCQMLLSIREPKAQCALDFAADVRSRVCLWIPCMVMIVILLQYDHTEGGVKWFLRWDTPIVASSNFPFNFHKLTTGSITGVNVNLINNKIRPSDNDENGPPDDFSL